MSLRRLMSADHRRMAWKNGAGETIEVMVHPPGAGLGDFGWRVSMAGVAEDGPFSAFEGIERSLAVLSGEGLELSVAGRAPCRIGPGDPPVTFPGDVACTARLMGGPVRDLNVMTRRGAWVHRLARADGSAAPPANGPQHPPAEWRLLLASGPARIAVGGRAVMLEPLDALLCEGPDAAGPPPAAPGLWLIEIARPQAPG